MDTVRVCNQRPPFTKDTRGPGPPAAESHPHPQLMPIPAKAPCPADGNATYKPVRPSCATASTPSLAEVSLGSPSQLNSPLCPAPCPHLFRRRASRGSPNQTPPTWVSAPEPAPLGPQPARGPVSHSPRSHFIPKMTPWSTWNQPPLQRRNWRVQGRC